MQSVHASSSSSHVTQSQMVKCPSCGKHYPYHSAERHIPVCIKNRQLINNHNAAMNAAGGADGSLGDSGSVQANVAISRV